eukprot:CAMPEP_0117577692 /NCGR_PEP_ID=MMETSP0784-20121206/63565_1 /TAXON_ID=39447 /ORGANISM="" /LENGTH=65 /DNA_ID=CAMNT_0005377225 /DNA_START=86 /DNA_END=279 /DNA_ORIENTATION=+
MAGTAKVCLRRVNLTFPPARGTACARVVQRHFLIGAALRVPASSGTAMLAIVAADAGYPRAGVAS